ncbi:MAG: hypothetical protein IRY83_00460 [Chloroflexi bacterium]|nr:hypothetical protein [Chloroflexota bacterium]
MMRTLGIIVVILALVDGIVHLLLDLLVMRGITARPPLSELFFLNFVGYIVLIAGFLALRQLSLRRLVSAVLVIYPLVTFVAWLYFTHGRGNPLGLAEISKPVEIVLAIAAAWYWVQLGREEEGRGVARAQT